MKNKSTYIRILMLIKPNLILVLFSLLLAITNVFTALYIPVLTGRAIDEMIGKGKVSMEAVTYILFLFAITILVNAVANWLMTLINNHIAFKIVKDLREKLFLKLENVPVSFLDSSEHGDILSRMISDVERLSDGLLLGFSQVFIGILTIAATLIFMIRINVFVSLIVILLTPVSLFAASFISKKTYKHFKRQANLQGALTSFINETVNSVRLIKAFGAEQIEENSFEEKNDEYANTNLKALFFSSLTNPVTRFVNALVYAAVAIFGAVLSVNGRITIGTLSCFLSYASQYTKPFNEISGVITEFQNAVACAGRIFEFLDEKDDVDVVNHDDFLALAQDNANSPLSSSDISQKSLETGGDVSHKGLEADGDVSARDSVPYNNIELTGEISIENLAFSYDKSKKLLYDLSFNVTPGTHIAICGPTGCGKTTFINLLMRFYEPDQGTIKYDGIASDSIPKKVLRKNIGMVLQETWLKSCSIADNISYGKPDASRDEIIEAAKKSHAHSFIMRLPNGYDTIVAPDGGNLSAGQKQLICIARLMLSLPPILILDEATSSIDTRTEIKITEAFEEMMKGRTSFIVAHRLSTIRNADLILVMKAGNIIEKGSHEELLNKRGFYYEMLNSK